MRRSERSARPPKEHPNVALTREEVAVLATDAVVAIGLEPAARSEDKKSACSIADAALESPSQSRGPSTNLRERPF
ncbi:hypothetical protein NK8_74430 (plasmid) [Caballeronia sp. NK8]|nr:hypothetical protein NK8_74430 [Caballeronia sp. NK8]